MPVSLEIDDLERKLVHERRGGYCFEQNLLLKAALEALGRASRCSSRGCAGARRRVRSALAATCSCVSTTSAGTWHADVGFGVGTLLEPIPFGPGEVHEQSGWRVRIVEDGAELVLQVADGVEWQDQYGFGRRPCRSSTSRPATGSRRRTRGRRS